LKGVSVDSSPAATAIAPKSTNKPNAVTTPATIELQLIKSLRATSVGPSVAARAMRVLVTSSVIVYFSSR
jgi:hypothetical protein